MLTMNASTHTQPTTAETFSEAYYRTGCGPVPYGRDPRWLTLFANIADNIVATLAPRTVLDAGCAMGLLVEALRQRGVEAWGIDISSYAIGRVDASAAPYCAVGSILEQPPAHFPQRYDLVVSIEVLEHLPQRESELGLRNLCGLADELLFSSSPDDTETETHYNVQGAEYWIAQAAQAGMWHDATFDAGIVTPWALLFSRDGGLGRYRRLAEVAQARERALTEDNQRLRERIAGYERGRVLRAINFVRSKLKV
jgi:SAM-dependent methyltransferase